MGVAVRRGLARWRRRGSSRAAGRVGRVAGAGGYFLWVWVVHRWAVTHGHAALLAEPRPWYVALAAITFWPGFGALWCLLYPADVLPTKDDGEV